MFITEGRYGTVLRAVLKEPKTEVFLKIISAIISASPMALNELLVRCKLRKTPSPHFCEFLGVYRDGDCERLYFAMRPYGINLDSMWCGRKGAPFSDREILELARQMTEAVRACHANGCAHRNVTPKKFVCESGSDLSKIRLLNTTSHRLKKLSPGYGTGGYAAPDVVECNTKNRPHDYRADIFSLGVSIWVLSTLCERQPHVVSPTFGCVHGEELGNLLNEMTATDPAKRPSLDEVLARINGQLEKVSRAPPADAKA